MNGTVKLFSETRGWGFIIEEWTGTNFFVHQTNCKEPIQKGDRVTFVSGISDKGLHAAEVALKN